MKRRGFLAMLAAAGVAAVAPTLPEAAPHPPAPEPQPLPKAGENYVSVTFRREPAWFDIISYTGIGSALTMQNMLGDEIGMIVLKCQTKPSDWFVIEPGPGEIVLPERFNEPGQQYVAYQFGREALTDPQVAPHLAKFKEMYT